MTFNYTRRFADFLNNFAFGRGVQFRSPKATEAIVPRILDRVWTVDNDKEVVLWEMGNQGGVSGDCFVKVAYEEAWQDSIGRFHPGRVRILPLNSSFCFPEFHPHDRTRLVRHKLKYRFWGTSLEGTRSVFTYTELITDDVIEEYINDQIIEGSPRPNPLGTIPIVHIANQMVSGSPWGLSDVHDVIALNREFNEKATDISDIINYHAAPVTVVTGAKASQLEKGPKKVWSGLPKDAQVFNLELGANLQGPMTYMEMLKTAMHEMTGVHVTALGQVQAISNTSGVALAIQYLPLMQVTHQKRIQYGSGLRRVNELVLLTISVKEPLEFQYSPMEEEAPLRPGQLEVLDPSDPISYQSTVHWPAPLPTDVLVKMNEEMLKMQLGLQSKRGALRELGEQFPDEKMAEIFAELIEDMEDQGALDLKRAAISRAIMELTGMSPEGAPASEGEPGGPATTSAGGSAGVQQVAPPAMSPAMMAVAGVVEGDSQQMMADLVTKAMGTKLPQRRSAQQSDD